MSRGMDPGRRRAHLLLYPKPLHPMVTFGFDVTVYFFDIYNQSLTFDYVPGPEHPPSPDYMPGPEHPPSPIEIPYVPELEYPEYLAPSDDEALTRPFATELVDIVKSRVGYSGSGVGRRRAS
uniref:Uncharacterized protein n=1 Tax=Tanacetum cinerariifolium TaxID=118510 RepID=A0A6L2NPW5_TANCI|nr:hypothetical protein [Tanacetum cinerariifolium]